MTTSRLLTPRPVRRLRRSFKTSGTFTVPADVYLLDLLLVSGGGGGGGGSNAVNGIGGGGGSGWPIRCSLPVTPGDVVAITVGAGGAGGAGSSGTNNGQPGANGGDTVVTVNGVEAIRIPGGGAGGSAGTTNSATTNYGRSSFGTFGAVGETGNNPYGGGGGAGYCGGLSGPNNLASVTNFLANAAQGYDRVRGGRRPLDLYQAPPRLGATNGWVPNNNMSVANGGNEHPMLVLERFLHICWGGTIAIDGLAPAAQPPNSGHGGTGAGQGTSVAANTGGNGGSGFALVEWDAAA